MRLLSNAVNSATTNDISRQADAFRAVGIDAVKFGETLRRDPIAALKQLAEAYKESGGAGGVEGP